jgi:hypothetical protein
MAAHQATRVVPWKDWDEWEHVRGGLCGADPTARDVALARVDAWRTRGNVPHAVEVTAQLMECRKHDGGVPGSPGPHLSDNMLQLTYAMVRIALNPKPNNPHDVRHPDGRMSSRDGCLIFTLNSIDAYSDARTHAPPPHNRSASCAWSTARWTRARTASTPPR